MNLLRRLFPLHSPVRKLWYFFKAFTAACWYRFPARGMKVMGVTGTDGKTSTVEMLSQILQEAQIPHLKISTDAIFVNGKHFPNETKRTTLSPWHTQKLLRQAQQQHVAVAVIEVSSHATDQNRIWGIKFDIAGITNITHDEHTEDHGSFENYANAKKKLFSHYLKPDGTAVLNTDNDVIFPWKKDLTASQIWFSTDQNPSADVQAHSFKTQDGGIQFQIQKQNIRLNLLGEFQMQNATVAFAMMHKFGVEPNTIASALEKFRGVAGRMEMVDAGQNFSIYIDDAQTPNAVEKGLTSLQNIGSGNVWTVFGACGGGRDKMKRPKIGKIVGSLSDFVILTDDEPYEEPPELIRQDVKEGITQTNVWNEGDDSPHFWEIADRRNAIEFALQRAKKNDVVYIFGMGSYTTRNIGGTEVPWNDRRVVEEILSMKKVATEVEHKEVREELGQLQKKVEGEK